MKRALVYDTATGHIERSITAASIDPDDHALDTGEAIVVGDAGTLPGNTAGKLVDPDTEAVVDDPEYTDPAVARADAKQAFRDARDAGDVQAQLDALFRLATLEQP